MVTLKAIDILNAEFSILYIYGIRFENRYRTTQSKNFTAYAATVR
jgi:hypothetical protein